MAARVRGDDGDGAGAPLVSVVVPVFNEEEGLAELQRRIDEALGGIDGGFEVVYVDDGSVDGSAALLEALAMRREDVVLVRLSRNFGMEIAMSAGMEHARGDYVALLHADLQDPPELIAEMLVRAHNGADVVYARRIGRDESLLKRTLATAFYRVMERVARTPYQGQAGDFRLMSRRVVESLRTMPERRRFLRGMVAWVGYEQVPIEYRRAGRHAGRGASYPALIRLAMEAITSFSDVPSAARELARHRALAVQRGARDGRRGADGRRAWSPPRSRRGSLIAVLFLGGAQLVGVGIVGRYLARVHDQALGRPLFLVDRVVGRAAPKAASAAAPLLAADPEV